MKKLITLLFVFCLVNAFAAEHSYVDALNSFEAIYNKKTVNFKWTLINPENVSGVFTIERSKDGKHFEKVSEISSTMSGAGVVEFADMDFKPGKKKTYYRLKFTDNAGMQTFSRIIFIEKAAKQPRLKVSVSKDSQGIEFAKFKRNEQVVLVVRDKAGNEFFSKSLFMGKDNQLILDKEMHLEAGDYVIVASSQSGLYSNTFTIH